MQLTSLVELQARFALTTLVLWWYVIGSATRECIIRCLHANVFPCFYVYVSSGSNLGSNNLGTLNDL